jgi:signal transduction histidine kinase
MVDITEDHIAAQRTETLQNTVRELTFDIGQILHANTSTLVMVNQTLLAAGRALEPGFDGGDDIRRPEDMAAEMAQKAATLVAALSRMLEAGDPERRAKALSDERWEKLERLVPSLENYEENIPVPEMRISALRSITSAVLAAVREMEPGHMPKEVIRDTVRAAEDLERRTCFMDILSTRAAVIQMDTSLAALRDFITAEIRTDDPSTRLTVASVIRESIAHLAEFARAARVDVVWRNRSEDIEVFGNRRDLLRAITNLLHNAIKYSWKREGDDTPWILIEVFEGDEGVSIEVENWGVPVEQVEIDAGLVFAMGYRGKRSKDRGRLGTGIGLTDSQRVAEAHRGTLTLSSKPARGSSATPSDRDYYRQPFLTRVRMMLPLAA